MPVVPIVFSVQTAATLEAALNAVLTPLLTARIFGVIIDQVREFPADARNISVGFSYDTVGAVTLATPFQCKTFSASTDAEAVAQFVAYTLLYPAYFFSEAYPVYRPLTSNPNEAVCLVVFYNSNSGAQSNWGGAQSTTPQMALNFSSLDAASRTPYPIADFDDFNYITRDTNTTFQAKWWQQGAGTGNATVIIYPGNKTSETGVVKLSTGTTTTGRVGLIHGYNLNWEPKQGAAVIRGKVMVDIVPDAINAYAFQLGLMNDTTQDASGRAYFSADDGSAFWQVCYSNGGGLIKTPTVIPIVAGEWIDLALTISAGGVVLKFYINGNLVFTNSLNVAGGGCSYGVRLQKKAGTVNRTANVDWLQGVLGNQFRPTIASILPGQ